MPINPIIQPEGNLWLSPKVAQAAHESRRKGLGNFLGSLTDETILRILAYLAPKELAVLCKTSHTISAFASFEEFWQLACLREASGTGFTNVRREPLPGFTGSSWKNSYYYYYAGGVGKAAALTAQDKEVINGGDSSSRASPTTATAARKPPTVYSDTLYRTHELVHGTNWFGAVPRGPPVLRLARSDTPDVDGFAAKYEAGIGFPVLLEGAGSEHTVNKAWDEESLANSIGDTVFHAGGANFRLKDYFKYARTNSDDQPLYLFDPTFDRSAPELLDLYKAPEYFADDLLSLLEPTGARPDYRWLLIGGNRSGQSWHKDPNGTSAWSLTIRGNKRWLFFPPHITPPGVIIGDSGERLTPISLAEWAREFYKTACATPGFRECETKAGDVVYVPRGWWHMVLNVAPMTIAVSHHFLSPTGLYNTLRLLRQNPHEVSGVERGLAPRATDGSVLPDAAEEDHRRRVAAGKDVYDRLIAALQKHRPEALARAEDDLKHIDEKEKKKFKNLIAPRQHHNSMISASGGGGGIGNGAAGGSSEVGVTIEAKGGFSFNFGANIQ